jgi:hypothetical protein
MDPQTYQKTTGTTATLDRCWLLPLSPLTPERRLNARVKFNVGPQHDLPIRTITGVQDVQALHCHILSVPALDVGVHDLTLWVKPGEHKTVQARFPKYVEEIGSLAGSEMCSSTFAAPKPPGERQIETLAATGANTGEHGLGHLG